MTKSKRRSISAKCPSCQSSLLQDAKFCHKCGALAGEQPGAKWRKWKYVISVVVLTAAIGTGLVLAPSNFTAEQQTLPSLSLPSTISSFQKPEQTVDPSTMSSREAADRLFNRVMAADESGDSAQALQFAPMALQAYQLVESPDADAHYHVGLINLVLGDFDEVRKQIEQLKRDSTDHLLGLSLALRIAKSAGSDSSVSEILARFAVAYDAEMNSGKSEYEAHRVTIEKLHALAKTSKTAGNSNPLPNRQESGAQLFESKCAQCHGPNASGSDNGPPLVHRIYEPAHHADDSFYRAVRQGVKSHHWPFGDMLPIPGVTDEQVGQIVVYVRNLQVKNGIK